MTKAEEYRYGASVIRKQYINLPNGPERKKLWEKEWDLILKAQSEEAKRTLDFPLPMCDIQTHPNEWRKIK